METIESDKLITILTAITSEVICEIDQLKSKGLFPTYTYDYPNKTEGGWQNLQAKGPNWIRFLTDHYQHGYKFPRQDLFEELISEANFIGLKDYPPVHFYKIIQIMANIISEKTEQNFSSDIGQYSESIKNESNVIRSQKRSIKVFVFLGNVSVVTPIQDVNFKIYNLSWAEKLNLYLIAQRNTHFSSLDEIKNSGDNILRCHSVIEYTLDVDLFAQGIPGKENSKFMSKILKGLRFLHHGSVFVVGKLSGENHSFYNPYFSNHDGVGWATNDPTLMRSDIGPMIGKFLASDIHDELDFIIDRTESLSMPKGYPTGVFDLISICEAIVAGEEGELSFKVPLYMTLLTPELIAFPKLERFELFRKCYKLRSKVAHCAEIKPKHLINQQEYEHLSETTLLLRDKLLEYGRIEIRKTALKLALE